MKLEFIEWIVKGMTVLLCGGVLAITLISHNTLKTKNRDAVKEQIRRSTGDTLGGKIFFYCIILFCLNGFYWGLTVFTQGFLTAAIVAERLITYRICRANKDGLGKFLARIDW